MKPCAKDSQREVKLVMGSSFRLSFQGGG